MREMGRPRGQPGGFSDFRVRVTRNRESDTYGYFVELSHVWKGPLMIDHGQTREEARMSLASQLRRLACAITEMGDG